MNYSIIVPTCNRKEDLVKLIDSILNQTVLPAEIIIIDQSENDDTRKYLEGCKTHLLTMSNKINLIYRHQTKKSLVVARNEGIDIATGEIVSFLDDDVVLFEDYYEKVLNYFNADIKNGGVGGNIIVGNKAQDWKWKFRKALLRLFLINNFDGKVTISGFGYPLVKGEIDRSLQIEMLSGCNMNFRKELLKNDKFDEWFTGYSFREDAEFSYRISRKTVLKMIPEAKLYHNQSRSNRMNIQDQKVMEVKNYYYFYKKHTKKTTMSDFLFLYSLFGLSIIYFKEYLCSFNDEKYKQFKGFVEGIIKLLKYKNTILKK
ncbi:MAG: glycosyltransferase [Candidatus Brocadia sp.]|nr:glycosyltransferase [Candidatus Brocadia sp.]